MSYLVISSSLNPNSRSRVLARHTLVRLRELEPHESVECLDAVSLDLPLCDGDIAYDHAGSRAVASAVRAADGVILALGIYNFSASAIAKTLLELADSAWNERVVGFVCASGGPSSYMAVMGLANSLMLDFRCVIVPRFVYAGKDAIDDDRIVDAALLDRIDLLARDLTRITRALRPGPVASPALAT